MNARSIFIVLVAATLAPVRMDAQGVDRFELRWDNDLLSIRGNGKPPDYDYTHGLEAAIELAHGSTLHAPRYRIAVGQRIYTPRRDGEEPVAGERPYAGWVYAAVSRRSGGPRAEYTLTGEVGVTGPAALGEPVQNGVHRLTGSDRQRGWANQLSFEPAFMLRARAERILRMDAIEVRPFGEASIGTLRDAVAMGLRSTAGVGRGFYGDAGARAEWIARDLFLDGNTFQPSVHADTRPFVAEAEAAVGHRWAHWLLEYRMTLRSVEYAAQDTPHRYGSVTLGWRR